MKHLAWCAIIAFAIFGWVSELRNVTKPPAVVASSPEKPGIQGKKDVPLATLPHSTADDALFNLHKIEQEKEDLNRAINRGIMTLGVVVIFLSAFRWWWRWRRSLRPHLRRDDPLAPLQQIALLHHYQDEEMAEAVLRQQRREPVRQHGDLPRYEDLEK